MIELNGNAANRARTMGLAVCALSLAILLSWQQGWTFLVSLRPDWVSVMPNTALACFFQGCAFACVARHPRWAVVFASLEVLIGFSAQIQWVTGLDLGIDALLMSTPIGAPGVGSPGRMSDVTAVALMLNGTSTVVLAALRDQTAARIAHWLATCVAWLAIMGLCGYATGQTRLLHIHPDATLIGFWTVVLMALTWFSQHWAITAVLAERRRLEWRTA